LPESPRRINSRADGASPSDESIAAMSSRLPRSPMNKRSTVSKPGTHKSDGVAARMVVTDTTPQAAALLARQPFEGRRDVRGMHATLGVAAEVDAHAASRCRSM
jgi:hypothetical protein